MRTNFSFSCRDTIIRNQVIICLTHDKTLDGFKYYLTGGFFPSITIYRDDESKLDKRTSKRIINAAIALFPDDVFED